MVPFSYVQSRFVEARLIREADCELKKQLKNMFLIFFYLFLPIFFLVCNNARSSEKCSAKIAKIFALPFVKRAINPSLKKLRVFGVMQEEREDTQPKRITGKKKKMNRELWGQETFHNMAFTAGLRNKEIKACNGVFLLKLQLLKYHLKSLY